MKFSITKINLPFSLDIIHSSNDNSSTKSLESLVGDADEFFFEVDDVSVSSIASNIQQVVFEDPNLRADEEFFEDSFVIFFLIMCHSI